MAATRILIVEDDEDVKTLLSAALDPPYETLLASNGMEGWQAALEGQPDLIISDIMMPIMDGHEFVRQLRRDEQFNNTPVIFFSALGSRDQIKKGFELGASLYLTKPIDPARLVKNVEHFIRDHGIMSRPKRKTVAQVKEAMGKSPAKVKAGAPSEKKIAKPAAPTSAGSQPVEASGGKVRLMIVEDDADVMEYMVEGLGDGYEIIKASDGMMAIERAARFQPDIFILDGLLPRITGFQLTSMIRKNRVFQSAPIIFISSKSSPRDRLYVEKLGVQHFLPKPFEIGQLQKAIRDSIEAPEFKIRRDRAPVKQAQLESLYDMETSRGRWI